MTVVSVAQEGRADTRPRAQSSDETLRALFLTLFLRGRSARGLQRETAPKSIASKLWKVLLGYALYGCLFALLYRQPLIVQAALLHATSFVLLGLFIAASSGDVLFNQQEVEILLHRPVSPSALLRAKMTVLVQVSLWMAGAFNLAGMLVGTFSGHGSWLFPLAHMLSTALEAVFCVSCVVITYQLCLRWFGRERLDGLMTTSQMLVSIFLMAGAQFLPRVLPRLTAALRFDALSWQVLVVPPAWFAAIDDAIAGSHAWSSWLLALVSVAVTAGLVYAAYQKLARDYESGLQSLSVVVDAPKGRGSRRWIAALVNAPPLRWWLRDPAARAAFMLSIAYMLRDRELKLRLYPTLASFYIFPLFFPSQGRVEALAFICAFLSTVPMLALDPLRRSQQWQAADVFRLAPLPGPAALCHGARCAAICLIGVPTSVGLLVIASFHMPAWQAARLLAPGLIALPVWALIPCLSGYAVPLSQPIDGAQAMKRAGRFFIAMLAAVIIGGIAAWGQVAGWLDKLIAVEAAVMALLYFGLRRAIAASTWADDEVTSP